VKILILGGTSAIAGDFLKAVSNRTSFEVVATYCKKKPSLESKNIRWIKLCLQSEVDKYLTELKGTEFDYTFNFILLGKQAILIDYNNLISKLFNEISEISPKIVNISSNGIYKHSLEPILESGELNKDDEYAKHKIISENILKNNQMNLRVAILPISGFGSGSLIRNIYESKNKSRVLVNQYNSWNGILSTHFAQLLITLIEQNLFVDGSRNIFSLNPEPTTEFIKAVLSFTDRTDLKIEIDNSGAFNKQTLSTMYKDFHNKIWSDSIYGEVLTTKTILEDLAKLRFHLQ
jgi:dTDP-4-dehydrorhamnose reductase